MAIGRARKCRLRKPFEYFINGDMHVDVYPLYISLHGGGETTYAVNDQQWENQKVLYGAVVSILVVILIYLLLFKACDLSSQSI